MSESPREVWLEPECCRVSGPFRRSSTLQHTPCRTHNTPWVRYVRADAVEERDERIAAFRAEVHGLEEAYLKADAEIAELKKQVACAWENNRIIDKVRIEHEAEIASLSHTLSEERDSAATALLAKIEE